MNKNSEELILFSFLLHSAMCLLYAYIIITKLMKATVTGFIRINNIIILNTI